MGIASVCVYICFILAISERVQGVPFLYNSGKSFITSIFSPAKDGDDGNIEDLRVPKMGKAEIITTVDASEEFAPNQDNEEMLNSPLPGLIQKKIGKILTKLQLFSFLTNGLRPMQPEEDQSNISSDFEDDNSIDKNNLILLISTNSTESNVYKINNPPPYLPPLASKNRITLYPAEVRSDEEFVTDIPNDSGNKISLSSGSIGVYFMELLGGLATLIYGAAIQVANAVSTPQPNTV